MLRFMFDTGFILQAVRQTVRILSMDHPQGILRTGDRATVTFEFISQPEFIKEGMKLLFREGKTKVCSFCSARCEPGVDQGTVGTGSDYTIIIRQDRVVRATAVECARSLFFLCWRCICLRWVGTLVPGVVCSISIGKRRIIWMGTYSNCVHGPPGLAPFSEGCEETPEPVR